MLPALWAKIPEKVCTAVCIKIIKEKLEHKNKKETPAQKRPAKIPRKTDFDRFKQNQEAAPLTTKLSTSAFSNHRCKKKRLRLCTGKYTKTAWKHEMVSAVRGYVKRYREKENDSPLLDTKI